MGVLGRRADREGGVVQGELVQMEEGWMGGRKDGLSVRGLEE